jgi:hypothetical protein
MVSVMEDILSAAMTLIAIILPGIAAILVLRAGFFTFRWAWRRHKKAMPAT